MCKEISWEEVEKQIKNENNIVLLGNGFSRSYDAEAFNQEEIIKNMPSIEGKANINDIEELINKTKDLVVRDGNNTANLSAIHKWIEENLRLEFIKALFEKMPQSIKCKEDYDEKTLTPYRDFLSNFNQIFTLNYDPLVYWMTLRLKGKFSEPLKKLVNLKKILESTCKTDKDYQKIEKDYNACLEKACASPKIEIFHSITKDNEYEIKIYKNGNLIKEKVLKKDEANKFFKKDDVEEIINLMEIESNTNDLYKDELECMKNKVLEKVDCDAKECENANAAVKTIINDGFIENKGHNLYEWTKENSKKQEIFYLHGAFHYFYKDNKIIKVVSKESDDFRVTMLKQVKEFLDDGYEPLTVLKDNAPAKIETINQCEYLKHCFETFQNHQGNLITYGLSFMESDKHIISAIKNNKKLEKVFIGYHNIEDKNRIETAFSGLDNVSLYCTNDFFKKLEHENQKELICAI